MKRITTWDIYKAVRTSDELQEMIVEFEKELAKLGESHSAYYEDIMSQASWYIDKIHRLIERVVTDSAAIKRWDTKLIEEADMFTYEMNDILESGASSDDEYYEFCVAREEQEEAEQLAIDEAAAELSGY